MRKRKPYIIHVVESDDTFFSISKKYGISVYQIINANRLFPPFLFTGQKLVIPNDGDEMIAKIN